MSVRADTIRRREDLYAEAVEVIARDHAGDLTVEQVSHSIATSRRQLQRVLYEVGGRSFRDLLTEVRMRRASELLSSTSLPVADVARSVGYRQPAQFAKTFRRLYGAPPSEYRAARGRAIGLARDGESVRRVVQRVPQVQAGQSPVGRPALA